MTINSRIIVARHYICDDDTLDVLEKGIHQLLEANELARNRNNGIRFGLKLTLHEKYENSPPTLEKIGSQLERLYKGFYVLFDPQNRGPGTSYAQILFNPTFWTKPHTVATADMDQYILTTNEAQERIEDLFERVERERAVYATGFRDVPVKLAIHEENSERRIIHELVHSLAAGRGALRVPGKAPAGVTPAYAALGESTSGFYVYNTDVPAFGDIAASVLKQIRNGAYFTHFGIDYYCAIKAAQESKVSTGYVCARENDFYERTKAAHDEYQGIVNFIRARSRELAITDVKTLVSQTINAPSTRDILSGFYSKNTVEEVLEIMRREFGGGVRGEFIGKSSM